MIKLMPNNRESSIELLRILLMIMILILHANGAIGPFLSVNEAGGKDILHLCRNFIEQALIVSVNVFVMISGYFGIKFKIKGLLSIIFQLCFYSALLLLVYSFFRPVNMVILKETALTCLGIDHWFIVQYLILYTLSPALNALLNNTEQKQLAIIIAVFFFCEFIYGRFGDRGHFHDGYSTLSFIGLYLFSGYLRRYPLRISRLPIFADFCIYLFFTILSVLIGYYGGYLDGAHSVLDYNHPFVILASVFFFLPFTKIQFRSRTVNWIAASAFSIYIIHTHFLVTKSYRGAFMYLYDSFPMWSCVAYSALIILLIATGCILIDKLRIPLWKKIQDLI